MKTTLMTIALAFATMPLTFAAQAPAKPSANNQQAPAASTPKVKKHTKKHSTKPAANNSSSSTAAAPAASPAKK